MTITKTFKSSTRKLLKNTNNLRKQIRALNVNLSHITNVCYLLSYTLFTGANDLKYYNAYYRIHDELYRYHKPPATSIHPSTRIL